MKSLTSALTVPCSLPGKSDGLHQFHTTGGRCRQCPDYAGVLHKSASDITTNKEAPMWGEESGQVTTCHYFITTVYQHRPESRSTSKLLACHRAPKWTLFSGKTNYWNNKHTNNGKYFHILSLIFYFIIEPTAVSLVSQADLCGVVCQNK